MRRLCLGLILLSSGCERISERLPPLPPFTHQNDDSISLFSEADVLARSRPTAQNIGQLGMLYHAYQFHREARTCYAIAQELEPDEFRWIYYRAKLEKATFDYRTSEALFLEAIDSRPDDAELSAELGDLYLMWVYPAEAQSYLDKALELDPLQPVAVLGKARLLMLSEKWSDVIELVTPLLARYPRLSKAHQYVGAAYGALGDMERQAYHQKEGEYGSAVESDLMNALNELAVPATLKGDPSSGREILKRKCARCHDHERIYDHVEDRVWWARTVRRMQREAGWQWLTDDEAASVVAYLAERSSSAGSPKR